MFKTIQTHGCSTDISDFFLKWRMATVANKEWICNVFKAGLSGVSSIFHDIKICADYIR